MIHHANGNTADNRIENLQCLTARKHAEEHTTGSVARRAQAAYTALMLRKSLRLLLQWRQQGKF